MWSVQGHPYDVWGNAGEGVGVIDISEDEGGHVDLRDGTVLSMREINGNIVDGVLVAVEGALVLRSGDDLVGVVNGREAWRVTSSGRPKGSPAPGLHALGVIDSSGGSWRRAEFISYDTEQARALGEVPQDPDHDWEHFVVVDGNADTVTVYA